MANPVFIPAVLWDYVAKTANYTITNIDKIVDCTSNSFTVTLPTAVGIQGAEFHIKNSGTGLITIATTSSQTIDGDLTVAIISGEALYGVSNGSNWLIL